MSANEFVCSNRVGGGTAVEAEQCSEEDDVSSRSSGEGGLCSSDHSDIDSIEAEQHDSHGSEGLESIDGRSLYAAFTRGCWDCDFIDFPCPIECLCALEDRYGPGLFFPETPIDLEHERNGSNYLIEHRQYRAKVKSKNWCTHIPEGALVLAKSPYKIYVPEAEIMAGLGEHINRYLLDKETNNSVVHCPTKDQHKAISKDAGGIYWHSLAAVPTTISAFSFAKGLCVAKHTWSCEFQVRIQRYGVKTKMRHQEDALIRVVTRAARFFPDTGNSNGESSVARQVLYGARASFGIEAVLDQDSVILCKAEFDRAVFEKTTHVYTDYYPMFGCAAGSVQFSRFSRGARRGEPEPIEPRSIDDRIQRVTIYSSSTHSNQSVPSGRALKYAKLTNGKQKSPITLGQCKNIQKHILTMYDHWQTPAWHRKGLRVELGVTGLEKILDELPPESLEGHGDVDPRNALEEMLVATLNKLIIGASRWVSAFKLPMSVHQNLLQSTLLEARTTGTLIVDELSRGVAREPAALWRCENTQRMLSVLGISPSDMSRTCTDFYKKCAKDQALGCPWHRSPGAPASNLPTDKFEIKEFSDPLLLPSYTDWVSLVGIKLAMEADEACRWIKFRRVGKAGSSFGWNGIGESAGTSTGYSTVAEAAEEALKTHLLGWRGQRPGLSHGRVVNKGSSVVLRTATDKGLCRPQSDFFSAYLETPAVKTLSNKLDVKLPSASELSVLCSRLRFFNAKKVAEVLVKGVRACANDPKHKCSNTAHHKPKAPNFQGSMAGVTLSVAQVLIDKNCPLNDVGNYFAAYAKPFKPSSQARKRSYGTHHSLVVYQTPGGVPTAPSHLSGPSSSQLDKDSRSILKRPSGVPSGGLGSASRQPRQPAGLVNLNNSCYMNATLQALISCEELTQYLVARPDVVQKAVRKRRQPLPVAVSNAWANDTRSLLALDEGVHYPNQTFNAILRAPNFQRGRHEDAHELLVFLLDKLSVAGGGAKVQELFGFELRRKIEFPGEEPVEIVGTEPCQSISLALPKLPPGAKTLSLMECFAHFRAQEPLDKDNWFRDPRTNIPSLSMKTLDLRSTPQILVVHLKRFEQDLRGRWEKRNTHVSFPIQLNPASLGVPVGTACGTYGLSAVVNHSGSADGGHYYTFRRASFAEDSPWFLLDDRRVSKVDESQVVTRNAYILFYIRSQPTTPRKRPPMPSPFDSPVTDANKTGAGVSRIVKKRRFRGKQTPSK